MTVRQLFYALVSIREIENCLRDYQRVSKAMTKARDDGRVDFELIVESRRLQRSHHPQLPARQLAGSTVLRRSLERKRCNHRVGPGGHGQMGRTLARPSWI